MTNLPKTVKARLQRLAPTTADPHPDADLLTAFAERSLIAPERDLIVQHLARCGDCREVVLLALPPQVELQPLADTSVNWFTANWFGATLLRGSALRWATVAAAVLLIASIGLLQTRRQRPRELAANVVRPKQATTAPAPTSQASPQMAVPQPRMQEDEVAVPRAQTTLAEERSEKKSDKRSARLETTISQPHANSAVATGGSNLPFNSTQQNPQPPATSAQNQTSAPASTVAVVAGSSQMVEVQTENAQITAQSTAPSQIEGQLIPNEPSEHLPAPYDRVGKAKPALAPAPYTAPTLMKGVVAIRWTISSSGVLQHSIDGGQTWLDVNIATDSTPDHRAKTQMATATAMVAPQPEVTSKAQSEAQPQSAAQQSGAQQSEAQPQSEAKSQAKLKNNNNGKHSAPATPVTFRALSVSSNANEVWAGGSGGALYHTLDGGNSWTRVLPAAGINLTGDILSVQFSDPRNGTVTTSTTEVWITPDDGQTWHRQP
jgi:Photosynthesis system II assembly factor YCF48